LGMSFTAFPYGRVAGPDAFVNRVNDLERLHRNASQGINTILIAPRRWGKSSLVRYFAHKYQSKKLVVCQLDLFSIREEHEFFELLSRTVLEATHTKIETALKDLGRWLGNITPKISFGQYPDQSIDLDFDFQNNAPDTSKLLNLAEQIAQEKGIRLVICIDEFQNIEFMADSLAFQKLLRSHWQHHQHVSYVLYGSKRHMMAQLFEKQHYPFYNFGQVMYLEKIPANEFERYIVKRFKEFGKKITVALARQLIELMENKPYYVQQLAFLTFNYTQDEAGENELELALRELITQGFPLYQRLFEGLSNMQVNLMHAVVMGDTRPMNSYDYLQAHGLNSSANVTRVLKALEDKEIIDRFDGFIDIIDPGFRIWWRQCLQLGRLFTEVKIKEA
jgi:AAA+ ATPase superfamily predicted ATPase